MRAELGCVEEEGEAEVPKEVGEEVEEEDGDELKEFRMWLLNENS